MAKSKHSNINHSYDVILKRIKKTLTGNGSDCMTVVAALKFISVDLCSSSVLTGSQSRLKALSISLL